MSAKARIAIAALFLSASAFVGILQREGYTDTVVIPTKGDVPTLGFGTTEGVRMGDRTTPVKAVVRALADVSKYEGAIKRCVTVPLHPYEYDAYADFAYNIGPTAFCSSTVVKRLQVQDYVGACDAVLLFNKVSLDDGSKFDCSTPGNKICAGLWTDRLRVHKICKGGQS